MISYKPSEGNARGTQVALNKDIEIFGESLGGPILHKLIADTSPRKTTVSTEITNASTWFYKDIMDYNFINGVTFYRVMYIGADVNSEESELISTISASVTNNYTGTAKDMAKVDASLDVELWLEGKFNFAKSVLDHGGLILDDEQDSTNVLKNAAWSDSISYNKTLVSGEYLKIWIKLASPKDTSFTTYSGYRYTVTVGNISIPVERNRGRLNFSTIYSTDLSEQRVNNVCVLDEVLPSTFEVAENVKVIDKNDLLNVFYFNNVGKLKLISIKPDLDITQNKYVDIDLSELTGDILESEEFSYTTFSDCVSGYSPGTSGTTGTSGTSGVGTSGTSGVDDYLGKKFIIDIFGSEKDLNIFYIFYNEFVTDSNLDYQQKYGHSQYNWNTGVIKVDVQHINEFLFETIASGATKNLTLTDNNFDNTIKEGHYINSYIMIDDLFIGAGFKVEDCRVTNNRTNLTYIWEKDIILNDLVVQKVKIPLSVRNYLFTVPNNAKEENYLIFNQSTEVDTMDTTHCREVKEYDDGTKYVEMGPPHKHSVDHGYSSITYDMLDDLDTFAVTWSFGINEDSNFVKPATPGTTGTSGTSGTSGTPEGVTDFDNLTPATTGTTGTTGTSGLPDLSNPYYVHFLYQNDFNDYLENPYPIVDPFDREYKDVFVPIFMMHCNGNEDEYALKVSYNFNAGKYQLTNKNQDNEDAISYISSDTALSLDYENVITMNTFRKQIYGCGKRYMVSYNLYINGEHIVDGLTYTHDTTDSYVITHNHKSFFTGHISYLEVRDGLRAEGYYYATTMFQILSNISWPKLETEFRNLSGPSGLEFYSYRRNIIISNLNWENADDFLYPITLQGNAYNVGTVYNTHVRRSIFDFNKINVNKPSFAFTLEGTSNEVEWTAGPYDFDDDTMVIWLRLKNWRGQRITMFYGDIRIINDLPINKVYEEYYGVWSMEKFHKENQTRFENAQVYNVGEGLVLAENTNGSFLIQLDKQYFFGNEILYGSNQFDITYDDREVHRDREKENTVEGFIDESVELFKPGDMELRQMRGIYPLKIESNNSEN